MQLPRYGFVCMTFFRTNGSTGFASYTVHGVLDAHDHHFIVVIVKIIIVVDFLATIHQLKHIPGADFIATPTANAG
tara:strand:+ start:316 stop:543 length:228 start_codon:yes stop_codon:yes gene_type:complete